MNLGESVATIESLKVLFLHNCTMMDSTRQRLMFGLSKCFSLTGVHVSQIKLTNSLKYFFGGPHHPGFTNLKSLHLCNSQLSKKDVDSLANALMQDKLWNIYSLALSHNRLTSCLKKLLLNVRYPVLNILILIDNELTRNDVIDFSQAIRWNKMPALLDLTIAKNNLTGCIKNLLGEGDCVRLKTLIGLSL